MTKPGTVNHNDPIFEQFSEEFRNICLDPQPVGLLLSKLQVWAILANLQLALRHPDNKGAMAEIAKSLAQQIEKQIATTPALAEVAKRGWNPKYDE
jgi:hypothetical protein